MIPRDKATGAVLAGERSRRMGRDKRLLLYEGKPLLLRAVHLLAPLVDEILVVSPEPPPLDEAWLRLILGIARTAGTPCVPLVGGFVHPIPGAYPRLVRPALEEALKGGGGALHTLLPRLGTVYVGEEAARSAGCDPGALANANTPEEWAMLAGPGDAPRRP
jgi:molybdopterin-guanine dinucleotide biosynthesis protein A